MIVPRSPFGQRFRDLLFRCQTGNLGFIRFLLITGKGGRQFRRQEGIDIVILAHIVRGLSGGSRAFLLVLHRSIEAVIVHFHVVLAQDLFGQIERESVGIVQFECIIAGENTAVALTLQARREIRQDGQTGIDRTGEFLFLLGDDLLNELRLSSSSG